MQRDRKNAIKAYMYDRVRNADTDTMLEYFAEGAWIQDDGVTNATYKGLSAIEEFYKANPTKVGPTIGEVKKDSEYFVDISFAMGYYKYRVVFCFQMGTTLFETIIIKKA